MIVLVTIAPSLAWAQAGDTLPDGPRPYTELLNDRWKPAEPAPVPAPAASRPSAPSAPASAAPIPPRAPQRPRPVPPGPGLVIRTPVGLTMEQGCTVVAETNPPFAIVSPALGARTMVGQVDGVAGYLPRNTLVRVNGDFNSFIAALNNQLSPMAGLTLLPVTVISTPDQLTDMDRNGRIGSTEPAQGARAQAGSQGMIRASDLAPLSGNITAPGSLLEGSKTIFMVERDTPLYDIPELEGRAVRLAQDGLNYLTKRCCPAGVQTETLIERGQSLLSRYYQESARDERCQYSPVFELLRNAGESGFQVEKQFALPQCDRFIAGLQPVSRENLAMVFGVANATNGVSSSGVAVSPESLERLQQRAWSNAIERRCLSFSRGRCTRWSNSGNFSKSKCRVGVREALQELGWLRNHPPGDTAREMAPWLSGQGFVDVTAQYNRSSENAPIGSIIVYESYDSRGRVTSHAGHVEMRVDRDSYCSDFCTSRPIDRSGLPRRVKAIYLPPRGT